jgi:arylsulfatase
VNNGIFSLLDLYPTLLAAAGNPNIGEQLLKGANLGGTTYKNHLDGYNQLASITGKGESVRHEIYYFGESTLGAVRVDDFKYRFIEQPEGWVGGKSGVNMPILTNLRLDPFERTGWASDGAMKGSMQYWDWFKYEFWRFVFVQQQVGKLAKSAMEYPPMQTGASFNLDALKSDLKNKSETPPPSH